MGAVARSFATVAGGLRVPLKGRYAQYRGHGPVGAEQLESAGASPLAVAFARYHPGPVPSDQDPEQWRTLLLADHG